MIMKKVTTAVATVAMLLAPTVAAAQAAPAATQNIEPAAETVQGSELRRTGVIIPFAGVLLIALLIYLLTKSDDKEPVSP